MEEFLGSASGTRDLDSRRKAKTASFCFGGVIPDKIRPHGPPDPWREGPGAPPTPTAYGAQRRATPAVALTLRGKLP